jgi:hypothetical protein
MRYFWVDRASRSITVNLNLPRPAPILWGHTYYGVRRIVLHCQKAVSRETFIAVPICQLLCQPVQRNGRLSAVLCTLRATWRAIASFSIPLPPICNNLLLPPSGACYCHSAHSGKHLAPAAGTAEKKGGRETETLKAMLRSALALQSYLLTKTSNNLLPPCYPIYYCSRGQQHCEGAD